MITKRIAALAALGALLSTAGPAFAATGSVTVKWNTQAVATITMYTQTTASKTYTAPAANDIYWAGNGSIVSGCAGTTDTASAGKDSGGANGQINFGAVTPDAVDYTDCMEENAIDAYVTTSDTNGYTVAVSEAGATSYDVGPNGALLCVLPDGAYANNLAWTTSARGGTPVAITSTTACPAGDFLVATSAPGTTMLTSATSTVGTELNGDMELVLAPNASFGAQTATVTYTLTPT